MQIDSSSPQTMSDNKTTDELSFKNNDPGAVRFGNFINYYQFHPPETRIESLPSHLWAELKEQCVFMDVGCNSGDLTIALSEFLKRNSTSSRIRGLGIDIDPNLIVRACERNHKDITFECVDIMKDCDIVGDYLKEIGSVRFDVTFCLSVTMWIHLNHGDDGLTAFLDRICDLSDCIVIEPQPWKCYRTAVRRLKKSKAEFPLYPKLTIRSNVESYIDDYVRRKGFTKAFESNSSEWDRRMLFYRRIES